MIEGRLSNLKWPTIISAVQDILIPDYLNDKDVKLWLRHLLNRNLLCLILWLLDCGRGTGAGQVRLVRQVESGVVSLVGGDGGAGAAAGFAISLGDRAVLADCAGTLVVIGVKSLLQAFGELKPILYWQRKQNVQVVLLLPHMFTVFKFKFQILFIFILQSLTKTPPWRACKSYCKKYSRNKS